MYKRFCQFDKVLEKPELSVKYYSGTSYYRISVPLPIQPGKEAPGRILEMGHILNEQLMTFLYTRHKKAGGLYRALL